MPSRSALFPAAVLLAVSPLGATAPAKAPWSVRTEPVVENSPDGLVRLEVAVPVLAGDTRPAVRDAINQALRSASGIDQRRREILEFRLNHGASRPDTPPSSPVEASAPLYSVESTFRVGVVDAQHVSLCFQSGGHTGPMATGFEEWKGCTFAVRDGKILGLADLFGPHWRKKLPPLLRGDLLLQDHDYFFADWEAKLELAEPGFYLKPDAVVFFYPKYAIAAGVRGIVTVEIPMERLRGSFVQF
jgi:hypothetical protein